MFCEGNKCLLCPRECVIKEGKLGFCRTRMNLNGEIYTLTFGNSDSSYHFQVDPIEKKPLYHFYPCSYAFSFGTPGCNLACRFCQNWSLSQATPENVERDYLRPEKIVETAKDERCLSIAYTYSEPTIFYEYALETSKIARKKDIKNVLITNGYISEEPLRLILNYVDALNIDVKSLNKDFYKKVCLGKVEHVMRAVEIATKNAHVELTYLVVTNHTDSDEDLQEFINWASQFKVPVHFSRYFPRYKFSEEPTPIQRLSRALELAKKKIDYVYLGNVGGYEDTFCANCGELVIKRFGYSVQNNLSGENCKKCGEKVVVA